MTDLEGTVSSRLRDAGLRPTRQRLALGMLLWAGENRHVTADKLHAEAKAAGYAVSMATVYNTLNQFVESGLLREVVMDGGVTCFDTNTEPHHHFLHEECGTLEDIPAERIILPDLPQPLLKDGSVASVSVLIRIIN
jgi:Fur family iron response transcriptional regulator